MYKFTITTDFDDFRDYWLFTIFQKRTKSGRQGQLRMYFAMFIVLLAAAAALTIVNYTVMGGQFGIMPAVLLIVVGAAFGASLRTLLHAQPKRQYEKVKAEIEQPQKFTFKENAAEVREDIPEENRESVFELAYDKIVCVYETKKAFYLFISDTQAFLIPKDQLQASGVPAADFAEFMREKTNARYFDAA